MHTTGGVIVLSDHDSASSSYELFKFYFPARLLLQIPIRFGDKKKGRDQQKTSMGAGVSKDEIETYLSRQEALSANLKQQLSLQQQQPAAAAAGGPLVTVVPNDFTTPSSGRNFLIPESMDDETKGLHDKVRGREKFRIEAPVNEFELEEPHQPWVAPTDQETTELLATKPWLAVIAPSSRFEFGQYDKKPEIQLELEHVYGFRSTGIRHHIRWVDEKTLLYPAGSTVVLHTVETNEQRFFREHRDEVLSVTIHRGLNVAATADQGRFPIIYVFDLTTLQVKARLTGVFRRGVSSIAFDATGKKVIALGLDDGNTLAVYDWAKGRCLAQQSADEDGRVFRITGNRETTSAEQYPFLTVGENHISFWELREDSGKLVKKIAELGKFGDVQTFTTSDSDAIGNFIGTQNGEVYCFVGTKLVRVLDCHQGSVLALRINPSGNLLITGGHDGYTCTWDIKSNFKRLSSTLFSSFSDPETLKHRPNSIRAIDLWAVSTTGSKVRSVVATVAGLISIVEPNGSIRQVVDAHHGDLSRDDLYGELWGLAAHPSQPRFVSAGDFNVFLWDASSRSIISRANLKARGCCAAWSPDGKFIAIGQQDGNVIVYPGDSLERQLYSLKCSNGRRVQCARFSPDSSLLAIGTAENAVELFDVGSGFLHGGRLTGAHGVVMSMDFSVSGQYLQIVSQLFELLFFDLTTLKVLDATSEADNVRRRMQDVSWSTQTCSLGWNVQGIWPEESQLDDVNHVSRSYDGSMLVTAEESGLVKVFQFPCVGGGLDRSGALRRRPDSIRAHGHGEKVTQVVWLQNDERIISTGGTDLCCFQWKVVRK